MAVSPLAPTSVPDMPAIAGVRLATAAAGIKYAGRTDVLLALLDEGSVMAGVFTQSKCPSAPVEWCRAHLKGAKPRALVVNSGNANAFTGKTGRQACKFTADIAAKSIVIYRYYDAASSVFGTGQTPKIEQFAEGLSDLILRVRELVCRNPDNKVAKKAYDARFPVYQDLYRALKNDFKQIARLG